MKDRKILAVDPSLTCSGWAFFSVSTKQLLAVGKIRCLPASFNLSLRLKDIQDKVKKILSEIQLSENDVLVCEAATSMKDPSAAFKVESVRGIFEVLGREAGAIVPGRINPRTVQNEVLGLRGKQLEREHVKDIATNVAYRLFVKDLKRIGFDSSESALKKNQDIVDALLLGHVALTRLESIDRAKDINVEDLFAEKRKSRFSTKVANLKT